MKFCKLLPFILMMASTPVIAEIGWKQGATAHRKLPDAQVSQSLVRLEVPHLKQGRNLCVPTSAAMVLRYFGDKVDPRQIKALAEGHKPESRRNTDFTYWKDLKHALKKLGYRWKIKTFPKSSQGFNAGLSQIKRHLRKGLPALIEVHQDAGHTFVVMGFDDARQVIYVRDPNLSRSQSRVISYVVLQENWHNHQFGQNRSAFFAYPRK